MLYSQNSPNNQQAKLEKIARELENLRAKFFF